MLENAEIDNVKDLFVRLVDSKLGFELAAEKAEQPRHKELFSSLAEKRHSYAQEIRKELLINDQDAEIDEGTASGSIHRFYTKIKNTLAGDDESLLEEILKGEDNLQDQYVKAIESTKSDIEFLDVIQNQYKDIESTDALLEIKEEAA